MSHFVACVRKLAKDRRAITALEYGFLASVLFGVILVGFQALANMLATEFGNLGAYL